MLCPNCKHNNPDHNIFCGKCATRLTGIPSATPPLTAGDIELDNITDSDGVAIGTGAIAIVVKGGGTVVIGEQPIILRPELRETQQGRYLSHIISRTRYLQLQGIRSGGKLVNIELEHIYITLRATRTRTVEADAEWLKEEAQLAPGERARLEREPRTETLVVNVEDALAEHKHLVILGDPGSGKTTLMRYLALCYARDKAEGRTLVRDKLGLPESGHLPLLVPLRSFGAFLLAKYPKDDGLDGHARLLEFLRAYLKNERIEVPEDFFDAELTDGQAALLFDGMDEVGEAELRRRVARMIESFAAQYTACRVVVTSRVVGYNGAARLGEAFATTTVRDFSLADVEQFLKHWNALVAVGEMGPGPAAEHAAATRTTELMAAIKTNVRVRELALNPLMLTVIALVHRDRVKLPDRRAELYAEAVDVFLGKWDEARGVQEIRVLEDRAFDLGDRRLLLQKLALTMHASAQKEIDGDHLRRHLMTEFLRYTPNARAAERAVDRFLLVIQERTGLLVEAGPGAYRFSHLTFQEFLAAVAVAEQDNYVDDALQHLSDPFWQETILLMAGYLSTKSAAKATRLLKAMADHPVEKELFANLTLAVEGLRDVGPTRVEENLAEQWKQRLTADLERALPQAPRGGVQRWFDQATGSNKQRTTILSRRLAAASVLSRLEGNATGVSGQYWTLPHGEPKWAEVPAGQFWMGSEKYDHEKPVHRVNLPTFSIALTPITNAQYWLYLAATGMRPPKNWEGDLPPKGKENHPVVYVSWHDALAYCTWLSKVTGKGVGLPAEAEWEKAARGDKDQRVYPWGDEFDTSRCNTRESGVGDTTPVGLYPTGASPYGCLDMAGNVWEWCQSKYESYPYKPEDGREVIDQSNAVRVVRGGSWGLSQVIARAAFRDWFNPVNRSNSFGFRICVRPSSL